MSEQGSEYAVINPAWRKNVKGRSPSLTRITDPHAAEDGVAHETPPPLPNRPSTLGAAREDDAAGFVGLDSDLVQRTREELDVSSRFVQSVRYVDVELSGKSRAEGSRGNRSKVGAGFVTYDTIDFPKSQPEGESGVRESALPTRVRSEWVKFYQCSEWRGLNLTLAELGFIRLNLTSSAGS